MSASPAVRSAPLTLGRSELKDLSKQLLLLIHPDKFHSVPPSFSSKPLDVRTTNAAAVATINQIVTALSKFDGKSNLRYNPNGRDAIKPQYDVSFFVWKDVQLLHKKATINLGSMQASSAFHELQKLLELAKGDVPPSSSSNSSSINDAQRSSRPPEFDFLDDANDPETRRPNVNDFTNNTFAQQPPRSSFVLDENREKQRFKNAMSGMSQVLSTGMHSPKLGGFSYQAAFALSSGNKTDQHQVLRPSLRMKSVTDAERKMDTIAGIVSRIARVVEEEIEEEVEEEFDLTKVAKVDLGGDINAMIKMMMENNKPKEEVENKTKKKKNDEFNDASSIDIQALLACRRISALLELELEVGVGARQVSGMKKQVGGFGEMIVSDGTKWAVFEKMKIELLNDGSEEDWEYNMKPGKKGRVVLTLAIKDDFEDQDLLNFMDWVFDDIQF